MYYFIEPLTKSVDDKLHEKFTRHSSDLSSNPEGYILTDEQIHSLYLRKFIGGNYYNIYEIPKKYQDNIDEFISDFLDGNIILKL